ncbi:MAG: hypothetical protein WCS15_06165 [Prevotella sp.]
MTSYCIQCDPLTDGYLIALSKNGKMRFIKKYLFCEMWLCLSYLKTLLAGGYKTAPAEILTDIRVPIDPCTILVANTDPIKQSFCHAEYLESAYEKFIKSRCSE